MAEETEASDALPAFSGAALWGVAVLLALANFVSVLDLTITNVSVPTIAGSLGASVGQGTWVITSYAVAEAITVPLTGWLARRFGSARVFAVALIAFAAVSLLCGLSPTIGALVACRVLQGACGGPLMPLSQALLLRLFPRHLQPAAMGLWSVTTLVAPICGPILGGLLCDAFGWSVIFLINVPVAALAGLIVWRILVIGRHRPVKAPFDTVGLGLLVVWVGLLQVTLDLGKDLDWFDSPLIVVMALTSATALVVFLIWELTAAHPIVNVRVFRHRAYALSMVAFAFVLGGFFATNVLTPLWLQTNLGYSAFQAGLAASATGVLAVAAGPVVAVLASRVDDRLMAFIGVGWLVVTTLMRGSADTAMTFAQVYGVLFLVGAAMPTFFIPLMSLSLGSVDEAEMADATGLSSFVRTLAGAFATSIVATRWENAAASHHAELAGRLNGVDGVSRVLAGAGMGPTQTLSTLNALVDQQAVMLATNQLFWEIAGVFALGLTVVWAIPRPRRHVPAGAAH